MIWDKIETAYKNAVYTRVDETAAIRYFSSEDFPGLEKTALTLRSSKGHRLQGYFYRYPDPKPGRIVIFEHGMSSGHRGYMKEIELLAKKGYLVFAYDHTGCMESGGEETGAVLEFCEDVETATKNADIIYTDVWVSMGEPVEVWEERIHDLAPYQVNADVMKNAGEQALFMHCLPAFHDLNTTVGREMGEKFGRDCMEVTDEVFESEKSIVFDEAENRMHTIKAVMVATLK